MSFMSSDKKLKLKSMPNHKIYLRQSVSSSSYLKQILFISLPWYFGTVVDGPSIMPSDAGSNPAVCPEKTNFASVLSSVWTTN